MLQPVFFDCNHQNPIDFDAVATWAWGGVFKANQGLGFTDPLFGQRRAEMEKRNLLAGGYDFATGDPVADNVARFLKIVNPGPQTACVLDFEDLTHNAMSGDQAAEWLDRVAQATGRAPWLYGGNRVREQIRHQDPKWIDLAKVVPLWLCQYKSIQVESIAELRPHIRVPAPWTDWTYLQYAADGAGPLPHRMPGVENNADLNVYDGTREQFVAAWPGVNMSPPVTA